MLFPFPCLPPSSSILILSLRPKTRGGGMPPCCGPIRSALPPEKADIFRLTESLTLLFFFYFSRKSSVTWHVLVPSYLTNYMFSWPTLKSCVCIVHGFPWYSSGRVCGGIWKTFCPQSLFGPRHSREDNVYQEHTLLWDGFSWLSESSGKFPISLAALVRFCQIVDLWSLLQEPPMLPSNSTISSRRKE